MCATIAQTNLSLDNEVVAAAAQSIRLTVGGELDNEAVVGLLLKNQVPLLSLQPTEIHSPIEEFASSDPFLHAVAEQEIACRHALNHYHALTAGWRQNGIQAVCFKSAGIAPSFPYTSHNFDILIRKEDEPGAREVLTRLGYVLLANCDEPGKWLYRLFQAGESLDAIHLHIRVGWGQGFMIEDELWKRARPSSDDAAVWIPGAPDVILINSAHALFENKGFGLHDIMKIRRAISDGVDWDEVRRVAVQRGWIDGLQFALAFMSKLETRLFPTPLISSSPLLNPPRLGGVAEQLESASTQPPSMPNATSWRLVKALYFAKLRKDALVSTPEKAILFALTMARGFKSRFGFNPQNSALFVLSGVDGSGKSRQAYALREAFDICVLRSEVTWARFAATPVMLRLSRFRSRRLRRPATGANLGSDVNRAGPVGKGSPATSLRIVWGILSSLDFAGWLLRIRWRLIRGRIVIADRYLCDLDVEMSLKLADAPRTCRALVAGLRWLAARPTRSFLLDVDSQTAQLRATAEEADFEPSTYVDLYRQKSESYCLSRIDAEGSFEETSRRVEREAMRSYFNAYGMVTNALFFENPWQLNRPVRKQAPNGSFSPTAE